jgi:SNF2 family DNA or RNA helicase
MTIHARNDNIQKFREDPDIKVMIASLKTGGVGLDLSVANKCILVDLWWNEAIEEQVSKHILPGAETHPI